VNEGIYKYAAWRCEMKIEINSDNNKNVQAASAVTSATAVSAVVGKSVHNNASSGLSRDLWDKRNLMSSLEKAWDSEDTAVISEGAKRGIVGDPRIVGEE